MSKAYSVRLDMVDGKSVKQFSSLKAVGKYIKHRFLGSDYIRDNVTLGGEFGTFSFIGFSFNDLGRFSYDDGFRDFEFFEEFGGTADPVLDPHGSGEWKIVSVHPHWGERDEVTYISYKTVTRALNAEDAVKKLEHLYSKAGDSVEGLEFNPWEIRNAEGKPYYRRFEPVQAAVLPEGGLPF